MWHLFNNGKCPTHFAATLPKMVLHNGKRDMSSWLNNLQDPKYHLSWLDLCYAIGIELFFHTGTTESLIVVITRSILSKLIVKSGNESSNAVNVCISRHSSTSFDQNSFSVFLKILRRVSSDEAARLVAVGARSSSQRTFTDQRPDNSDGTATFSPISNTVIPCLIHQDSSQVCFNSLCDLELWVSRQFGISGNEVWNALCLVFYLEATSFSGTTENLFTLFVSQVLACVVPKYAAEDHGSLQNFLLQVHASPFSHLPSLLNVVFLQFSSLKQTKSIFSFLKALHPCK